MKPDGSDQKVARRRRAGVRLRVVARRQVDRLRPHGRLVRQRAVHRAGRRADGRQPARNVTRYATYNGDVTWSRDRQEARPSSASAAAPPALYVLLAAEAGRRGHAALVRPATIDWDDIHLRAEQRGARAAPSEARHLARRQRRSPSAPPAAATTCGSPAPTAASSPALTTGGSRPAADPAGRSRLLGSLIYFLDGSGRSAHGPIARAPSSSDGGRRPSPASCLPGQDDRPPRRGVPEMFDQSWRYLAEHFYDPSSTAPTGTPSATKYRPLVKHVAHEGRPVRPHLA